MGTRQNMSAGSEMTCSECGVVVHTTGGRHRQCKVRTTVTETERTTTARLFEPDSSVCREISVTRMFVQGGGPKGRWT